MKSIKHFFDREQNLLVHIIAAVFVILLGIIIKLDITEWLLVLFAIGFVITCELINSAVELTVDLYTKKFNSLAMVAKDTASAGVLVSAITALIIGTTIFIPKILNIIN